MRILALDIGSKKTGLAISDLNRRIISPLSRIVHDFKFSASIFFDLLKKSLIGYWNEIDSVVIGNGKDSYFVNPIEKIIDQVVRVLRSRTGWKISLVNETYSSVDSRELLKRMNYSLKKVGDRVDSYAALLLLKDYFDSNKLEVIVSF